MLLKNVAAILLQNATVFTKCNVYYKLQQYNEKRGRRKSGWIHNFDSLHTWGITYSVCSTMRLMISWWVNFFLSWYITSRANFQISIIPFPCSLFFALHLEWSLKYKYWQKVKCNSYICELLLTLFSQWFKFSSAWAKKKVVLFPKIGWVKIFLSLIRPHSRVWIRIYIFLIKKNKITAFSRKQFLQKILP